MGSLLLALELVMLLLLLLLLQALLQPRTAGPVGPADTTTRVASLSYTVT
jgi:hypothetical protein